MTNWHKRFLDLSDHIAGWSKDSTKVGCVIVGPDHEVRALGYNGLPRGAKDNVPERSVRPAKYLFATHAEENAICNAARTGTRLDGCTAYASLFPCVGCSKSLIQSGISSVVTRAPDFNLPVWGEQFSLSIELFHETGVKILWGVE